MKVADLTIKQCKKICKDFITKHNGFCEEYDGTKTLYRCPLRGLCDAMNDQENNYKLYNPDTWGTYATFNDELLDTEIEGL